MKLSHYLKLNSPEPVVVNESYDQIPLGYPLDISSIPDYEIPDDIPVFSEYIAITIPTDYLSIENSFLSANASVIERLRENVEALTKMALFKEIEVLTVLNHS